MSPFILMVVLARISAEETTSPEKLLKPRNFNPHPYKEDVLLSKFYKHLSTPEPTKQGPVLFPNNATPSPKTPLIVTSRPLAESVSRSELNPTSTPLNNSIAQPSYLSRVQARPNFAPLNFYRKPNLVNLYNTAPAYANAYENNDANLDDFLPYRNVGSKDSLYDSENNSPYRPLKPTVYPIFDYKKPEPSYAHINFYKKPLLPLNEEPGEHSLDVDYGGYDEGKTFRHPYASLLKKSRLLGTERHRYNDYEEQTILPPIYKALSDHARQNVLKTASKHDQESSRPQDHPNKEKDYSQEYNDYSNELEKDSEYGKKYAFSYSVRDHKTGDDFSHSQRSSGASTNGEYRVRLPDGRMQIVSYTADEGGYRADVKYAEDDVEEVNNDLDGQNDSLQKPNKPNAQEDYHNRFNSKQYYNDDYQYDNKVQYKNQRQYENPTTVSNKFGPIVVSNNDYSYNGYNGATATPRYDGTILITPTRKPYYLAQSTPKYNYKSILAQINVQSTTESPNYSFRPSSFENTERVVHIGSSTISPFLYTSVQNRLSNSGLSKVSVGVPVSTISPFYKGRSISNGFVSSTLSPLDTSDQKSSLGNFESRFNKYLRFN